MKKVLYLSIVIAILAAFFASKNPDGLDFVAEKLGFAGSSIEHQTPMANYSIPFLPKNNISTAFAGIAGILIIVVGFSIFIKIVNRRP